MIRIFIWVVLFLILTGCMTAPQRQVKEVGAALPDQWGESETFSQPIPTQWVETFGDAQLSALVDTALASNYELKAAAARVGAAVAQARIDGSSRWPQFFSLPIISKFKFVRPVSVHRDSVCLKRCLV